MVANTLTLKKKRTEGDIVHSRIKTLRDSPSSAHHAPSAVIRTVSVYMNRTLVRLGNYFTK